MPYRNTMASASPTLDTEMEIRQIHGQKKQYLSLLLLGDEQKKMIDRTKTDVHSLGEWRVNGALRHIGAWHDAFNVKEGDPMFLPAEERVSIW